MVLASSTELASFLEGVERRAFKRALYGLQNEDDALDAVQDAMMKLSASYGDRSVDEFPMLFQRILGNVIRDMQRRKKVRSAWVSLFSALRGHLDDDEGDGLDVLEHLVVDDDVTPCETPESRYDRHLVIVAIERELARLPERQREAFLMRYLEEMDTSETAAAMGCSEGSVKTHCSRASRTLAAALQARGISL